MYAASLEWPQYQLTFLCNSRTFLRFCRQRKQFSQNKNGMNLDWFFKARLDVQLHNVDTRMTAQIIAGGGREYV